MDETRDEDLSKLEINKNENEKSQHLMKCFVENLDKNQWFERLFSDDKHKNRLQEHAIEIDHIIEQYRVAVSDQIEQICNLSKEHYNVRTNEMNQFERAIGEGRKNVQSASIEIINDFLQEKRNVTKRALSDFEHDDCVASIGKTIECDALIDSVCYSLLKRETTVHEQIEEVRKKVSAELTKIVNQFMDAVGPLFDVIRIACEQYFKMIGEKARATGNRDEQLTEDINSDRTQHLALIDRSKDNLLSQAKEWLATQLHTYERFV